MKARALTGLARANILQGEPEKATEPLADAMKLARQADRWRSLAAALQVRSEQQAALDRQDEAAQSWAEARKLFAMLHAPEADRKPDWLDGDETP